MEGKMSIFLKLAPLVLLLAGCDSGTETEKPKSSQNVAIKSSSSVQASVLSVEAGSEKSSSSVQGQSSGANLLKTTNIILYDKGGVIGKTTSVSPYGIGLYSEKGYMYSINWDGKFSGSAFYYSDSNCLGDIYIVVEIIYGKSVFYNKHDDNFYTPNDTLTDGTAIYQKNIKTKSFNYLDSCMNYPYSQNYIGIKPVLKKDIGIPEKITPPLRIEFE